MNPPGLHCKACHTPQSRTQARPDAWNASSHLLLHTALDASADSLYVDAQRSLAVGACLLEILNCLPVVELGVVRASACIKLGVRWRTSHTHEV